MNAKRRVEYTRQLLESIGLEGQRLQMINISSAMGGQFAFAAAEITAEVQRLGPNRLRRERLPESTASLEQMQQVTEIGTGPLDETARDADRRSADRPRQAGANRGASRA